jgi:hypothetical protein
MRASAPDNLCSSNKTKDLSVKRLCLLLSVLVTPAYAQSEAQCEQVRQAVQQYGYRAARAHAERTMPPEYVRAGEACLHRPRQGAGHVVRHHPRRPANQ